MKTTKTNFPVSLEELSITQSMIRLYNKIELRNVDNILKSFNELEEVLARKGLMNYDQMDN